MSIIGVTSTRASAGLGLFRSTTAGRIGLGGRTNTAGFGAGPAYILGGGSTIANAGVYDATGLLLSKLGGPASQGNAVPVSAKAAEQRIKTLGSAANKIQAGATAEGRAQLKAFLDKNPTDATAIRFIGHSYMAEQDYTRATQFYTRAAAFAPTDEKLQADLVTARALQKSDKEALAEGRQRLKSPSHRVSGLRLLFELSERSPGDADIYLALADGFSADRNKVQVAGALHEAVRAANEQQIDGVIDRARQFAQREPQVGFAHNILGRALGKAGRFDEAIAELTAATGLVPENLSYGSDLAGAYAGRALARLDRGNVSGAESDILAARDIDPTARGLNEAAAHVAAKQADRDITAGRYTRAAATLRGIGSYVPRDAQLRKDLSGLYIRMGIHFRAQNGDAQALANFEKAYTLDSESITVRKYVAEAAYAVGVAALNSLDYDSAIANLERAYATYRPDDTYGKDLARAYNARGQQRVALNELDDAILDFSRGFSVDSTNTTLNANYAAAVAQRNSGG